MASKKAKVPEKKDPYWMSLPLELRAEVLEDHYLTASDCLNRAAADRDMWQKGYREWSERAFKAEVRVRELEDAIRLVIGPFGIPKSVGIMGHLKTLESALEPKAK